MSFMTPRYYLLAGLLAAQMTGCATASRTYQRIVGKPTVDENVADIDSSAPNFTASNAKSATPKLPAYDKQALLAELQSSSAAQPAPQDPSPAVAEVAIAGESESPAIERSLPVDAPTVAARSNRANAANAEVAATDWVNDVLSAAADRQVAQAASGAASLPDVSTANTSGETVEDPGFRQLPFDESDLDPGPTTATATRSLPLDDTADTVRKRPGSVSLVSAHIGSAAGASAATSAETVDFASSSKTTAAPTPEFAAAPASNSPVPAREVSVLIQQLAQGSITDVKRAIHRLGQLGPQAEAAVPALEELLIHGDQSVPIYAALAIHRIDPDHGELLPALIEGLHDDDPTVRSFAASALSEVGDTNRHTVPTMRRALDDPDPFVRLHVAEALAGFPQYEQMATVALIECLQDDNGHVRWLTTFAIASLRPESRTVTDALVVALSDSDSRVRSGAAFALGEIGAPAAHAQTQLRMALNDADADVRAASAHALSRIPGSRLQ